MAYPDYNELLSVLWGSASIEPVGTSALIASASNIFVSTNVSDRPTIGGGGNQPIVPPVILAAPTPTVIPLTLAGAFEQSANLFNITSFNGVDGNLMSVDETGLTTVPKLRLSGLHNASALATDGNGSIVAAVLAASAFIDTTNAYNISSGILDAARLPVIPVGNISGLAPSATIDTTNANNISSGILAVARLPMIPTTKISGLATVATSGLYADLINKPLLAATIAAVTNQFLTSYNATTGLFTQAQVSAANIGGLATVATTGSYTDLTNKPVLPLNTPGIPDQVLTSYNAATGAFAMAQLAAGNITGLAVVAATGSYTDLLNKPVLAATNAFTASQFFTSYNAATGLFTKAQVAASDITGVLAPGQIQLPFPAGFGQAPVATQGVTIAALAASGASAIGLRVQAPTGATANYAATFMGGFVGIGTATPKITLDFNSNLGFQVSSDNTMLYFLPNVSNRRVMAFTGQGNQSGLVLAQGYAVQWSPDSNALADPPTPADVFITRVGVSRVQVQGALSGKGIGTFEVGHSTAATASNNFSGGNIRSMGAYWDSAASQADYWNLQNILGAGANPTSTLVFSHTGSPGSAKVVIPTFLSVATANPPAISLDFTGASLGFGVAANNAMVYFYPNVGGRRTVGFSGQGSLTGLVLPAAYALSFNSDAPGLADPPTASDVFVGRFAPSWISIQGQPAGQNPGNLALTHNTNANAGNNFPGGVLRSQGSYWTGAASAADLWQFVHTMSTPGANPTSTFTLSHSGSPGTTLFSIAAPTKITDTTAATGIAIGSLVTSGGIGCTGLYCGPNNSISGGSLIGQVATFANNAASASGVVAIGMDLRNGGGGFITAMNVRAGQFGSGNANAITGFAIAQGASVVAPQVTGVSANVQAVTSATITLGAAMYISAAQSIASGVITNNYGLYIESQTVGTALNLAVYTAGTTPSSFGGNVGIGTTAPKSPLHVMNLPIYATNAAAITGGLTAGAFYRIGADPDHICVVH